MPQFVRIIQKGQEVLFNLDSVWKIEIEYAVKTGNRLQYLEPKDGVKDPSATRIYNVFFAGGKARLLANPDDPVMNVFEKLYREALKASEPEKKNPAG